MISAVSALVLSTGVASAADFSFTGSFDADDDVQYFDFVVGSTSDVQLMSLSYAGGVNSAGQTISAGGFDPILTLFNKDTGAFIADNDDGNVPDVNEDVASGNTFDTFLEVTLNAGNYTVAISQFDNRRVGLLFEGFLETDANFTSADGCSNGQFCDVDGNNRTPDWAFDIRNVNSATTPNTSVVPLPASGAMLLAGLGVAFGLRRRKTF
jgi:hypothetical protein